MLQSKSIGLRTMLYFEIRSWIGRHFQKNRTVILESKFKEPRLLDLGVGGSHQEGWINADFFSGFHLRFWRKHIKSSNELELDLRFPINCKDSIIDGVYSGHTLEHLTPKDALAILKEIYRILKPGSWLRINVPDLEVCIQFYNGVLPNINFEMYNSGCECIHELTQDSGHLSVWDRVLLARTLNDVGFVNVNSVKYGVEGTDKRLIKDGADREWCSLVLEAQKPN